jgi:hypothetical protein
MHFDKKKQEINAFWPFFFTFFSLCLRLFQVLSWLKQKKLQKDEILGAFAPKITSFYTTDNILNEMAFRMQKPHRI